MAYTGNRFIGATALVAGIAVSAGGVPGLPEPFTYGVRPGHPTTAWYIDGREGVLRGGMCIFLGDLEVPAMDDRGGPSCPGITVRHLVSVDVGPAVGKCRGLVCGYDHNVDGTGETLTTDVVEACPDIIVTVAMGGEMEVVATKWFDLGDDPTPYFARGKLVDMSLLTEKRLVDKYGGKRYRKQVAYWLGSSALMPGDSTVVWRDSSETCYE